MKKLYKIFVFSVVAMALTACSLETEVYDGIPTEDAFKGVQDVQNAMNGAYQAFADYDFYGTYVVAFGDLSSDVSTADPSSGHFVAINGWNISEDTPELSELWSAGYRVLDRCVRGINGGIALLANPEAHALNTTDINNLNSYISQMYSLRALTSFVLVNFFGLPYNPSTSNNQPGIVLVDTEPIKEFEQVSRATVAQTYTQIEKDIASAKSYMSKLNASSKAKINQYYFNEAAIYALEARVKLYMNNWNAAATAAQKAIDLRASSEESFESYILMWRSTAITKEDIFTLIKSDNDNLSADALNTLYGSYGASLSSFTLNQFSNSDIRKNLIGQHPDYDFAHPGKFDGTATAQAVSNIPVFRKSEMYLILAECKAQLNMIDESASALFFTAKRDRNINSVSDLPSTKQTLLNFISRERVREFFQEGHRYFDLRRTGEVANIAGNSTFKMSNFVFPIPSNEINSGSGVAQNENWSANLP